MKTTSTIPKEADTMHSEESPLGGRGGRPTTTALNLDCRKLKDLRLIKRAVRDGWPVHRADRPILIDKVVEIVSDESLSARHRLTAMEICVLMVKQNHARRDSALNSVLGVAPDDEDC
ncbi:hypothetical protein NG895_05315 [Aeoliella sp. ICT_H6.2]|uniref:Uncharacterized protein n=1 Tax=Aeoliella straminimaris TaxID=2954799 RepID=A0A9X2JHW1_9BACT|nr:hypothetical protein [Aeoliella straminimaris]MCO6043319.1 hypothetical protein [Aeoliella straminimaris]